MQARRASTEPLYGLRTHTRVAVSMRVVVSLRSDFRLKESWTSCGRYTWVYTVRTLRVVLRIARGLAEAALLLRDI